MVKKPWQRIFLLLALLGGLLKAPAPAAAQSGEVTAFDLIIAMNTLRVSNGLTALVEDSIIDAVAQSTAEIMAANQMSWHIGDVAGRLKAAGYGGPYTVWGTENFAVSGSFSIDEIMLVWSDASHMIPALNPAYCNIGAGVAKSSNGMTYYVLQAAYSSGKACGEYISPVGTAMAGSTTGGNTGGNIGGVTGVSQIIVPVEVAAPDAEGKVYHVVKAGQSFWSIAVAYKMTIKDLQAWNNLTSSTVLRVGQKLFIPGENTAGYTTPTPVGMFAVSAPDPDGKIIHTVAAYHTLTTISTAYGVSVAEIVRLNNWQEDWPLQIGQKLVINAGRITPSPTPRPLTAVEKLTPAADGKYYHTIQSGQTLSWIAGIYAVNLAELLAWNGMNGTEIIMPGQKLVLQVTPPATQTATPGPPTATPTETLVPPTGTATPVPTITATASPTPELRAFKLGASKAASLLGLGGIIAAAAALGWWLVRRKRG